ncbi:MAG: hypothetical protein ACP5D7_15630 [Limnospira sp.]
MTVNYPIQSLPQSGEIRTTLEQPTLYIFNAEKGQHVTLIIWAGTLQAELYSPSGRELAIVSSGRWGGTISETGIYRIMVYPQRESTSCAIEVQLQKHQPNPSPIPDWRLSEYRYLSDRPIVIKRGDYGATLEVIVRSRHIQPLTIRCRKDQMMKVSGYGVSLAIQAPDGKILDLGDGGASARLPQDGMYRVLVLGDEYPLETSVTVDVR